MDAVSALRNLVDAFHKDNLPSIKPLIPSLLNQLFALMNEVCFNLCSNHHPEAAVSLLCEHSQILGSCHERSRHEPHTLTS